MVLTTNEMAEGDNNYIGQDGESYYIEKDGKVVRGKYYGLIVLFALILLQSVIK